MPKKPIVLVWNAAGHVGFATVGALLKNTMRDYSVRAGVPDPVNASSKKLSDLGAHCVQLDPKRSDTVSAALSNVQRLVLIPPSTDDRVELSTVVVNRARELGVKFIAMVSVTSNAQDTFIGRQFKVIERAVESTGIPFCILRAQWFMDNLFDFAPMIKRGVLALPIREGRIPLVRVKDLGDAFCQVIGNPQTHQNKSYEITGPESLTGNEMACIFSKVLGTNVKFVSPAPEETYKLLISGGFPESRARTFLELFELYSTKNMQVSVDLERLLAKKPTKLEKWIKLNPCAFMNA